MEWPGISRFYAEGVRGYEELSGIPIPKAQPILLFQVHGSFACLEQHSAQVWKSNKFDGRPVSCIFRRCACARNKR